MKNTNNIATCIKDDLKNFHKIASAYLHNIYRISKNRFNIIMKHIISMVKRQMPDNRIMLWSTFIMALATVVLAIATWRNTNIVRNDYESQYRPCLFLTDEVKFGKNEKDNNEYLISFVLYNSGRSSANNVIIEFTRAVMIDTDKLEDSEYIRKLWNGEDKEKEVMIEFTKPIREKSVRVFPQQIATIGKFVLKRTDLDREYNDKYDIGIEFTLSYNDLRLNRTYIDGYHLVLIKNRKGVGSNSLSINSWEIK